MSDIRIVCVEHAPCSHRHDGHIVAVGTGVSADKATDQWTVSQVLTAMGNGHRFYTQANGFTALVNRYTCPCGLVTLRSSPDATTANNLDNLRICRWRAA